MTKVKHSGEMIPYIAPNTAIKLAQFLYEKGNIRDSELVITYAQNLLDFFMFARINNFEPNFLCEVVVPPSLVEARS